MIVGPGSGFNIKVMSVDDADDVDGCSPILVFPARSVLTLSEISLDPRLLATIRPAGAQPRSPG